MEISNKVPSIPSPPVVQAPRGKVKTTAAVEPSPNSDRVQISAQAREMQAARQAIRQMPEVDLEKVAQIKARIKAGRYEVDAQAAASKMMMESLLNDNK
jgi:flagellar biosynthesis anti-sigma factor FlgM